MPNVTIIFIIFLVLFRLQMSDWISSFSTRQAAFPQISPALFGFGVGYGRGREHYYPRQKAEGVTQGGS